MKEKMTGRRVVLRLTEADEAALAAIRDHVRTRDPWAGKAPSLRAALREAAKVLAEEHNAHQ